MIPVPFLYTAIIPGKANVAWHFGIEMALADANALEVIGIAHFFEQ
jgi:hypothetical protein